MFLQLLVAAEVISTVVILNLPIEHNLSQTLGIPIIAQEAETTTDQNLQPSEPTQSTQQTEPTQDTEQTPTDTNTSPTTTTESANQTPDSSSLLNEINNNLSNQESPAPSANVEETPTSLETSTQTTKTKEETGSYSQTEIIASLTSSENQNTNAVLNSADVVATPESINQETIESAQKQEQALSDAKTPEGQTMLLLEFAKENIKILEKSVRNDDFSSAVFVTQRINDQIDTTSSNLEKVTSLERFKLRKQIVNFCKQADFLLRNQELSVPEEAEIDVEITRAKCLNTQQ